MNIFAIDPGKAGAIAFRIDGQISTMKAEDFFEALPLIKSCHAGVLEDVGGHVGKPQPGGAMFKFGYNAGRWAGVCIGLGVRLDLVRPQVWQKGLPGLAGLTGEDRKRALRDIAKRLFPGRTDITLATADAILMLDWYSRNLPECLQ